MYTTPHAKQRFFERVDCSGLPRKNKEKIKYIENYIKNAFYDGSTPNQIKDKYLHDYMNSKLKQNDYRAKITKITHYKNNLFLFHKHRCVTILDIPERANNVVDNAIYISKLHPFINHLKETKVVKQWLHNNGKNIHNINDLKKIICSYPLDMDYYYVMNKLPLSAIRYIKNDSAIKKIIIKTNKTRNLTIKNTYYVICALLLLIPRNQISKLQKILKNNKKSIFNIIDNKMISKKQIDVCYKQMYILLDGNLIPKYKNFNINDNSCYDLINDYFNEIIHIYIVEVKKLFKEIM